MRIIAAAWSCRFAGNPLIALAALIEKKPVPKVFNAGMFGSPFLYAIKLTPRRGCNVWSTCS